MLQKAAQRADSELIEQILQEKPDSVAVSMAFPYIFDADLSEADTLHLIDLSVDYHDAEERLDVMFSHPKSQPAVFRALAKFPRSVKMLQILLDAGYYHDQMTVMRVMDEVEEDEQVSLLFWALSQPQKRVSSAIIELLIDRGAKVNFETRLSKTTPLMLAIQNRRPDLVKALLAGAEVDVMDATGNTPMTMATHVGGGLGTAMMSNVLAADPKMVLDKRFEAWDAPIRIACVNSYGAAGSNAALLCCEGPRDYSPSKTTLPTTTPIPTPSTLLKGGCQAGLPPTARSLARMACMTRLDRILIVCLMAEWNFFLSLSLS